MKNLVKNNMLPDLEKVKSELKQTILRFDYCETKLS